MCSSARALSDHAGRGAQFRRGSLRRSATTISTWAPVGGEDAEGGRDGSCLRCAGSSRCVTAGAFFRGCLVFAMIPG